MAPLVLRDPTERGLTIRVQGKRAAWYLKFNGTFKRLGAVGNPETKPDLRRSGVLYSGREATELAGRVRQLLRLDQDPSDYLSSRALGLGHARRGRHDRVNQRARRRRVDVGDARRSLHRRQDRTTDHHLYG